MKTILRSAAWIFEHIILNIPLAILLVLGISYVYVMITAPVSIDRLHFLLSIDAATATLAGLSFYASYASRDDTRRTSYFKCAEQLFHASILMFFATIVRGSILIFDDFPGYAAWRAPLQMVLIGTTIVFFLHGLFHLIRGLRDLLSFVHQIYTK